MVMLHSKISTLNLHGETRDTCVFLVEDFIRDNIKLKNKEIAIIHGRSSNILKNKVHEILKRNKNVTNFYVDIFNPGVTVVKLNI